jgi:hypothetical protein
MVMGCDLMHSGLITVNEKYSVVPEVVEVLTLRADGVQEDIVSDCCHSRLLLGSRQARLKDLALSRGRSCSGQGF